MVAIMKEDGNKRRLKTLERLVLIGQSHILNELDNKLETLTTEVENLKDAVNQKKDT